MRDLVDRGEGFGGEVSDRLNKALQYASSMLMLSLALRVVGLIMWTIAGEFHANASRLTKPSFNQPCALSLFDLRESR